MNVLVVDDSEMARLVAKNCLKNLGVSGVLEAEDGVKALEVLGETSVDIIFSDWNMPNMTGIQLLEEVRKQYAELPFIMITTEGSKQRVLEAMKFGVNDYLAKPFTPAALKEKLKKWVTAATA